MICSYAGVTTAARSGPIMVLPLCISPLSCLVLSCLVLSVFSGLVLSCLVLSYVALSCLALSRLTYVLPFPIESPLVSARHVLALPCRVFVLISSWPTTTVVGRPREAKPWARAQEPAA